MKARMFLISLSLVATSAFAQQNLKSGIDKANFDLSVKPGNDFYHYAAGGWLKSHPLDAEHPMNGAFVDLDELNQKRIRSLIEEYANTPQQKGTLGQKIGSIYRMMMDSVKLNKDGYAPLKPYLDRVAAIKDIHQFQLVSAQLDKVGIGVSMFDVSVGADQRNASMNIVGISQGGIGLPERDYYLKDDDQTVKVREAYKAYLKSLLMMVGNDEATATKKMEAVMAIETRIAKASYDRVKLRDIDANYHKMPYSQLVSEFPGIDWGQYFFIQGFPEFESVDVGQPEPVHEVEKIYAETSLDDLKAYAEARVASSGTGTLSDDFRAVAFKFSSVLSGVSQDRPRWKRSVGAVSGVLGQAIGKLYVEKYFPESSKQRVLTMVHNLQAALAERIDAATWMSAATKAMAKDKLQNFIIKIGYPDKWRDYSSLVIDDSLSLYENMRRVSAYMTKDYIERKVNKPVNKAEWLMTPQTINAYYNPTTNEICFPAAILQPPFFDAEADDAVNYGGIGAVIGHEMSHGFDDQGCQFDKTGNQHNWWTAADKANFDKRTKVLEDYFGNVEILPGVKVNGKQTLGENIGDNGGLNIALQALQNQMKKAPLGDKDGFTPEQRFFLNWARVWASNASPQIIDYLVKSDVHSPNEARVNNALPHIDAWYKAFGVKKGDKLFIPKNKRAHVW
ncbi:MAG: M13 family metallopeptidase [Prevotella sp.]|nr:M13 family metallopeptidase [Prevotella sp.]